MAIFAMLSVVGGLLSAHLLSHRGSVVLEPGWPCSGPLLRLAEKVARKLLPGMVSDLIILFDKSLSYHMLCYGALFIANSLHIEVKWLKAHQPYKKMHVCW